MIGPIFLREGLVAKFKDHISSVPYCIVIHNAKRYSVSVEKRLATEEVSSIVNHFLSTRYPIVCFGREQKLNSFLGLSYCINRWK